MCTPRLQNHEQKGIQEHDRRHSNFDCEGGVEGENNGDLSAEGGDEVDDEAGTPTARLLLLLLFHLKKALHSRKASHTCSAVQRVNGNTLSPPSDCYPF